MAIATLVFFNLCTGCVRNLILRLICKLDSITTYFSTLERNYHLIASLFIRLSGCISKTKLAAT
jgi:hypothetical protein